MNICNELEKIIINSEKDLKEFYCTNNMEKEVYDGTQCGCCYRAEKDYIGMSGYAEGSDMECPEHKLYFPFTMADWNRELMKADEEGCNLWNECNGD